ncbi:MAG: endonuclease/exonuclease/phosphatase family protein [Bacteroidetes bacterium]|nr:endonuclease/exonuclease/phosphatase family protein [Bacteroidota bacterium]
MLIDEINRQEFDFLIVTENVASFQFNEKYFVSNTIPIPVDTEFQHLDYGSYLKGETPIRCSIFSKYEPIEILSVIDSYTCIARKYLVENIELIIYASIIGTYGISHQMEIAKPELCNFKTDIANILIQNKNLIIAGDLNTSFFTEERKQLTQIQSRFELINFTNKYHINRATEKMKDCIDHIFFSEKLNEGAILSTDTFFSNNQLKDEPHKGIIVTINNYI